MARSLQCVNALPTPAPVVQALAYDSNAALEVRSESAGVFVPGSHLIVDLATLAVRHAFCASMRPGAQKHTIQSLADPRPALLVPMHTGLVSWRCGIQLQQGLCKCPACSFPPAVSPPCVQDPAQSGGLGHTRPVWDHSHRLHRSSLASGEWLHRGCIPHIKSWSMAAIMVPIESHQQPAPFWNGLQECRTHHPCDTLHESCIHHSRGSPTHHFLMIFGAAHCCAAVDRHHPEQRQVQGRPT
jgi:hypothetical protein